MGEHVMVIEVIDRTRPVDDLEPKILAFVINTENVEEIIEGVLPHIEKALSEYFENPEELILTLSDIAEVIREHYTLEDAQDYWEDESGELALRIFTLDIEAIIGERT